MKTGISKQVSPAVVYFRYDGYMKTSKMHILRDSGLTFAKMELFMVKLESKGLPEYSKTQNLQRGWLSTENPDVDVCDPSFIQKYLPVLNDREFFVLKKKKRSLLPKPPKKTAAEKQSNTVPRKHKFVFVTGDKSICATCASQLRQFEQVVGMFSKFDIYQTRLQEGSVEFLAADIMSLPLEDLVPGELPVILYFGHEEGKEAKSEVGIFYFEMNRFGRMVQLAVNKPNTFIESVPEFLNLLSIELDG